jgi:hypothetical protein
MKLTDGAKAKAHDIDAMRGAADKARPDAA